VDPEALARHTGALSGGQQRIAAVALSLLKGTGVDLGDVITGVDPVHRYLILVALAHAGGDRTAWAATRC
jgi:ABC-type Mn2+/Zn2+ transport system ATPase subunit